MVDPATSDIVRLALRTVSLFIKNKPKLSSAIAPNLEEVIARGVGEALEWSSRSQIFGMSVSKDPLTAAIPLRISETPRRFRGHKSSVEHLEEHLLTSAEKILLLGDPGSGKTTTLKRLTQKLINGETQLQLADSVPIVIRFREMKSHESLLERIAKSLGMSALWKKEPNSDTSDTRSRDQELWIGLEPAKAVIADFMREYRIVLILDGLDEAPLNGSISIRNELSWLSLNSHGSQIIISCRSGDHFGALEGFRVYELSPLNALEIQKIVELSGLNSDRFMTALRDAPYYDLADRPLFLTQLLLIFEKYDYLPKQPSEVYRLIVLLSLREWDAERGLSRSSKYSDFSPDRKLLFLAAISYHLTFRVKQKIFTTSDLHRAYSLVCSRFDLPPDQATAVVIEIESHTGLIVISGYNAFEFCHLSLQEYLAAEYISRETHAIHLHDYLDQYPAPVAISIALASDPSLAFASLFLRGGMPEIKLIHSLLHRLILEVPIFDISAALGTAILKILSEFFYITLDNVLMKKLIALPGVKDSIIRAFLNYREITLPPSNTTTSIKIKRVSSLDIYPGIKTPDSITFNASNYATLIEYVGAKPESIEFQIPQLQRKKRHKSRI